MIKDTNWMKLMRWSRKFRPSAKQLVTLPSTLCFLVSANSAYAGGVNGLPPVVVHPVHTFTAPVHSFTTPVHFSAPTSPGSTTPGTPTGSTPLVNTTGQTGTTNNHNVTVGTHSVNNAGTHHGVTNGTSVVTTPTHVVAPVQTTLTHTAAALPGGGYQLDLSSPKTNILLGSALFNGQQSVTINVGGTPVTYTAGSKVTAAEYVAIQQSLNPSTNLTPLALSQNGTADGGQFSLNKVVNANVTEVVVPKGVTAIDFTSAHNSSLNIAGDLTNYGSVFDVSRSGTSGAISATDILNEKGGLI